MVNTITAEALQHLINTYGSGKDGSAPTLAQWQAIADWPDGKPLTLVNLFKLREIASYPDHPEAPETASGQQAFHQYAAVSGPALERAGGRFMLVSGDTHSFIGPEEDWDMIVVGSYPDKKSLLSLFQDTAYMQAYRHRSAACQHQRTYLAG